MDEMPFLSSILDSVCLNEVLVNDGQWHTIKAAKFANFLLLEIDTGDQGRRNDTTSAGDYQNLSGSYYQESKTKGRSIPSDFKLDIREGVTVGGIPDFSAKTQPVRVYSDLSECKSIFFYSLATHKRKKR